MTGIAANFALATAAASLASFESGAASALLVGPGFALPRTAAKMLAVSLPVPTTGPAGFAALAAGFAAGVGVSFAAAAGAAASPAGLPLRAAANISATLIFPPGADDFAAGAAALAAGFAGAFSAGASAAGSAPLAPPSAFRAAANISATDGRFFSSAITKYLQNDEQA
jgi:hypothetical protein